jgi:PIN domain nuclease of toxin-antitoxin system
MRLLMDTHTFIWWDSAPEMLSRRVLTLCENRSNTITLSVVSVWEMQIKFQLGKLKLDIPLRDLIENQQKKNELTILPITLEHTLALDVLEYHHRDPFDRLLIAQCNEENMVLLSKDNIFSKYTVNVIW